MYRFEQRPNLGAYACTRKSKEIITDKTPDVPSSEMFGPSSQEKT